MLARLRKLFRIDPTPYYARDIEIEGPEWDLDMRALCAQIALRNGMSAEAVQETYGEDAAILAKDPHRRRLPSPRRVARG